MLRRQWAPKGPRPIARVAPGYEWLYLYAFVRPATGQVVWFLGNTVNTALFAAILASFAREIGVGPGKSVLLVLDNAGWHASSQLIPPPGVRLCFLPPYSPELQPAERLWPLTNEAVANRGFATLSEVEAALSERCRQLTSSPPLFKPSPGMLGGPRQMFENQLSGFGMMPPIYCVQYGERRCEMPANAYCKP